MHKTSQVGVLLPFLTLPPPDTFASSVPLPWSAYLGLLLPLPLTALLLSILSNLSPYQVICSILCNNGRNSNQNPSLRSPPSPGAILFGLLHLFFFSTCQRQRSR